MNRWDRTPVTYLPAYHFFFFLSIYTFTRLFTQHALFVVSLFLVVVNSKWWQWLIFTRLRPRRCLGVGHPVGSRYISSGRRVSMLNFEFPVTLVRCRLRISNVPSLVTARRETCALRCADEFDDPHGFRMLASPYGYTQTRIWYNIVFEAWMMRFLFDLEEGCDDGGMSSVICTWKKIY